MISDVQTKGSWTKLFDSNVKKLSSMFSSNKKLLE
jgi:hypothetical protein